MYISLLVSGHFGKRCFLLSSQISETDKKKEREMDTNREGQEETTLCRKRGWVVGRQCLSWQVLVTILSYSEAKCIDRWMQVNVMNVPT